MKLKQIALLVAGVLASASAVAGVTPAQIELARQGGTLDQAFITGASAPTKSVYEGFVGSGTAVGCDPGTQSIFTSQGAGSIATPTTNTTPGGLGNVLGYACTRGTRTLAVYHSIAGGSLTAYTPHTLNTNIERLRFLGLTCSTGGTTGTGGSNAAFPNVLNYVDPTNVNNNATVYKGCTNLNATDALNETVGNPGKPVGGFSDVEAALFASDIGGGNVTSFGTEASAYVGQVFGVVVSTPLYRALQVAQGITANTNALDPNFDPANAPSISREQYASIASGTYQNDWAPILGATGAGKKVILARRVATSGTQASSNAFFLGNPCLGTVGLTPTTAGESTPTYEVFEGSGTGNVKTRITTASNNGGTDNFAIGVVSAENDWRIDSSSQNGYRFVKVDGVHPEAGETVTSTNGGNARTTAANGTYNFHMELKTFVSKPVIDAAALPGSTAQVKFKADIVPQIARNLNNPQLSACAVLPRGLTLNPTNPDFVPVSQGGTNPNNSGFGNCAIVTQIHKGSNQGNNCAPYQLFY